MKILLLDTIHGGTVIGAACGDAGLDTDLVDVYRNGGTVTVEEARAKSYDLVIAPVHLDPGHPLVAGQRAPVISHHEAVRMLLGKIPPSPMVEITGARGKTTTAHALACLLPGPGVLLSSRGLILYPRQVALLHPSITPASVLPAAEAARQTGGWLVAEESLGVTGAGDLAILTSAETYRFAAGTKDALAQKLASLAPCARVLLAPGIDSALPQAIQLEDVAEVTGTSCRIDAGGRTGSFTNDLLAEEAYRIPLMLAGSAACLLGIDPAGLSAFAGVEGRMNVRVEDGLVIVDNANSGTTQATTIAAAELARRRASSEGLTLVIGTEPGDGKVCEGFSEDEMISTVRAVHPDRLVVVGDSLRLQALPQEMLSGVFIHRAPTLAAGTEAAVNAAGHGAVVLAVKTWR